MFEWKVKAQGAPSKDGQLSVGNLATFGDRPSPNLSQRERNWKTKMATLAGNCWASLLERGGSGEQK
jgi:hypothetical protein